MSENDNKIETKAQQNASDENYEETRKCESEGAQGSKVKTNRNTGGHRETVVDFLRNFLVQRGMTGTLDCFQEEWHEMVERGLIDPERVDVIPDVYVQTRRLELELKDARKDRDAYKVSSSAAAEAVVRAQKARDFHRLRHNRVLQERDRLIQHLRTLQSKQGT